MDYQRRNGYVLLVDDEPCICLALAMLLQSHGYQTVTACSCDEALQFIAGSLPAVILSDVNMPHRSGLDLLRELRSGPPALRQIPVVLVSALTRADDRTAGLKAGAQDYIFKPFAPERILRTVELLWPADPASEEEEDPPQLLAPARE